MDGWRRSMLKMVSFHDMSYTFMLDILMEETAPGSTQNEHQELRTLAPAPPTNGYQGDDSSAEA